MSLLIERAKAFAIAAHAAVGQKRKYSGQPYHVHCERVAANLRKYASGPISDEQIAAAWLHDTVEDTQVSLEVIRDTFGQEVEILVEALTDISRSEDGNRKVRKAKDLAHTALAPAAAKTIKLSDLIDNGHDITHSDPGFAHVYLREKAALLEVLREGDQGLWQEAKRVLDESIATLQK